jgi:hypothetical protein
MKEFHESLAAVQAAKKVFEEEARAHSGSVPELFEDVRFEPDVFAQILMNHLPNPESRMSGTAKKFWIDVLMHMGPDWLPAFRKVGGFMTKTGEF